MSTGLASTELFCGSELSERCVFRNASAALLDTISVLTVTPSLLTLTTFTIFVAEFCGALGFTDADAAWEAAPSGTVSEADELPLVFTPECCAGCGTEELQFYS